MEHLWWLLLHINEVFICSYLMNEDHEINYNDVVKTFLQLQPRKLHD